MFKQVYKGLKYYPKGTSAYVDVWNVVDCMIALMNSTLKNERYILIAENLPFKIFQDKVAKALNVKLAKKEASPFLLSVAWRLDWLSSMFFGKRRKLSKQMAKSISSKTVFDNSKLKRDLDFNFTTLDESIARVSNYYLEDFN